MTLWPPLLVAAALGGSVEVSDRSEIRVRDSNEAVGRTMDLETTPAIAARLHAPTWEIELGYGPRLTLRQLDHLPLPEAYHHGLAGVRFRLRGGELALRTDTSYGTQSFASLASPSSPDATVVSPPLQALPRLATIDYVSSRSGISLRYAPRRRLSLSARVEYVLNGGTDALARSVVPFQYGPAGALEATWALTRTDRIAAAVSAQQATFSPGPDDTVGDAQLAWRHRLDRRTESTLAAGAAVVWRRTDDGSSRWVYPIAEAALDLRAPPQRIETRFSVRLAPVVSWLNGLVDERVEASARLTWAPRPITTLRAQVGVAQGVRFTEDGALTLVLGEAAMALRANRSTQLELGTRGAWQKQRGADALPPQWVVFAGATFVAPALRF